MADLMQQARELLAAEFAKDWQRGNCKMIADAIINGDELRGYGIPYALAAIAAALRAAPEGGVPERTMMALATGWRRHAASGGRGRAVLIQCAESLEAAVIAARPQGVKDV